MQATITKTHDAQPAGEYVRTAVDEARDAADIRIVGHVRNKTEIHSRKLFSGAGVKMVGSANGVARYIVSDEALTELRRRYSVATDF